MKTIFASIFLALFLPLICSMNIRLYAQDAPPQQPPQDERIVVSSNEVSLDAVVKDKKGRPVRDLTAADFEVYEDGVRQQVNSFRLVTKGAYVTGQGGATATNVAPAARPTDSVGGVSAVALVFDRMTPDARNRAREAALAYVRDNFAPNEYVGVFMTDLSLKVLQTYTNDSKLVRQAVAQAGNQSGSLYTSSNAQARSVAERQAALQNSSTALEGSIASGGAGGGGSRASAASALGGNQAEQMLNAMIQRSLETFEALERDQQGYATTNGLLAIVNSMRRLPGRKAIIFFSEGISIPPAVQAYFRAVVSSANRANTTVYAVDAAGLRADSPLSESRQEINALALRRADQANSTRDYTGGPLTRQLERNEDLLRLNPQSGLGQLANETGGFLISDTNNIGPRLRQVDDDLNTYYLLTYTPQNANYDGRFRQISLKLDRSNLEVQARKGYYAINPSYTSPVLPYEATALAALDKGGDVNRPDAFPFGVGGLSFPEDSRPGFVSVIIDVPSSSVTYATDNVKKTYNTDFSIVALIKNSSKQVVKKMSNQFILNGALDKIDAAKHSGILFYRETDLPPGRYTVEAAVADALSGKTSVRTGLFEIPTTDDTKLRLSDIVLIKRAERISPEGQKTTNNPFVLGEVLAYPNLNEPVSKTKNKQLAVFFTTYEPKGATAIPKLTITFTQNGRSVGQTSGNMTPPDAKGRIQFATSFPLDKFPVGVYELQVSVRDEHDTAARSVRFVVDP